MSMSEQNLLEGIMIGLLLAGGYLGSIRALGRRTAVRRAMPVVSIMLLVFFGVLASVLFFLSRSLGTNLVLTAMLVLTMLLILYGSVVYAVTNFYRIRVGMLALFVLYILVVLSITVISRDTGGDHSTSLLRTDLLLEAVQTRSLTSVRHILQNVALFVPIGFLLPCIDREGLGHLLYPVLFALAFSILIESIQLFFNLGQADLTDILANVLGAVPGYLVFRLFYRTDFAADEE